MYPSIIIKNAIDLQIIGCNGLAWRYKDAIVAVHALKDSRHVISGGDVFTIDDENRTLSFEGDSWFYQKCDNTDNVAESSKKAIEYITRYYNTNGDNYCYLIVIETCSAHLPLSTIYSS